MADMQALDPLSLYMLINAQMFGRNPWDTTTEKPTTRDLATLAAQRVSPYGKVTIKQPKMTWNDFIQSVILPMVSDLFTARELKKPILDDRTIDRLKQNVPDIEKYLQKDEKTGQYKFTNIDEAPQTVKEVYNKVREIEEARQRILSNPRNFLRPGLLSVMMQNPNIASTLFDVSGQIEQSIKAGQKKEAMKNIMSKTLEKLGIDKKDLEKLDWEDLQSLMSTILKNFTNLFGNLNPMIQTGGNLFTPIPTTEGK
jgi:hypothetical protein